MSKTLETKRKILNLLKKKEMTISGLSEALNLSTATVSQHIDELQNVGAIEKIENEHFKKLKYYRAVETTGPVAANYVKYIIGAVIVLALVSVLIYSYHPNGISAPHPALAVTTVATTLNTTTVGGQPVSTGSFACPLLFYSVNGSIENYSGFSLYYLNSSYGRVADYVIASGSVGKLYATEHIGNVLQEPSNMPLNRTHYAVLNQINNSFNGTSPGLNYSFSPQNFTIKNNTTENLTMDVVVNSTAPQTTYWLRIDGPCGGGIGPVLLTVGNKPYNGTVTEPKNVYA